MRAAGTRIIANVNKDDGDFTHSVPTQATLIKAVNKCPRDATVDIDVVDASGKTYTLNGLNGATLEVPVDAALPLQIEVSDGEFGSAGAVIGEVPLTYATGGGPRGKHSLASHSITFHVQLTDDSSVPPIIDGWNTLNVDFCPPDDGD